MRDPHRALPPEGKTQRVETLRRQVDDALSALNWVSEMQDACVAPVDILACSMLGDFVHRRCANFCRGPVRGLTGSRRL